MLISPCSEVVIEVLSNSDGSQPRSNTFKLIERRHPLKESPVLIDGPFPYENSDLKK